MHTGRTVLVIDGVPKRLSNNVNLYPLKDHSQHKTCILNFALFIGMLCNVFYFDFIYQVPYKHLTDFYATF